MIRFKVESRVADIELARPDKKNALTGEMYGQLADALETVERDPQIRAALVHGSDECFCSGNDVADFLKRPPLARGSPSARFFDAMLALDKPLVAAVAGPAVGIGTTMLLHCDFVYAADNARFQMPFVPLGIVPEFGSTYLLPLLAGYQRAAELLLLGQPFDARKAQEAGIVTEVLSQKDLFPRVKEKTALLAALAPKSLQLTKQLLKKRRMPELKAAIEEEIRIFGERLNSPEAKEAMAAFLEKRKPDFSRF